MPEPKPALGKLFARLREPYRAIASAAILRDGEVLLVRESSGGWNLPGGRLRPGESPTHAAVRETREETGLKVDLDALAGVYRYINRSGRPRVRYVFWASGKIDKPRADGKEILQTRWFSIKDAQALDDDDLAKPALLRQIFADLAQRRRHALKDLEQIEPTAIAA